MFVFSSRDDFIEAARNFHGSVSPGLMIGASMVQLALHFMGGSQHFHASVKPAGTFRMPCSCSPHVPLETDACIFLNLDALPSPCSDIRKARAYVSISTSQKAPAGPISGDGHPERNPARRKIWSDLNMKSAGPEFPYSPHLPSSCRTSFYRKKTGTS